MLHRCEEEHALDEDEVAREKGESAPGSTASLLSSSDINFTVEERTTSGRGRTILSDGWEGMETERRP